MGAGVIPPAEQFGGIHVFDRIENIGLDLRVFRCEPGDQRLDRSALGIALQRFGGAGAGQEGQAAAVRPCLHGALTHQIQRADQLHPRIMAGGKARQHGLHLPAVQQPHQNGFDRIVVMVAEGDLAASALLRFGIQVAAAHFSTQKAGMPGRVPPCDAQYIRAENFERQRQPGGVLLQLGAALRGIARIHSEKAQRKIDRVLQILQQEGEQHGVLSPGNAHRDAVARLHERIVAHRAHKGLAQRVPEFVLQGVPDLVCVHRPFFLCWKW